MYDKLVAAIASGDIDTAKQATKLDEITQMLEQHWSLLQAHPQQLRTLLIDAIFGCDDPEADDLLNAVYASGGHWLEPISPLTHGVTPRAFQAHDKDVKGIVLLDDGSMLTASEDGAILQWEDGQQKRVVHMRKAAINSLVRCEDRFLSASDDHAIRVWDADTLKSIKTLSNHSSFASMAIMAGDTIASISKDQMVSFNGQTTAGHQSWVHAMAASPDGQWLITAGIGGGVLVWRVSSQSIVHTLHPPQAVRTVLGSYISLPLQPDFPHKKPVALLAWPTPERVISVGAEIVVWDATTWTPLSIIAAHSSTPRCMAIAANGSTLVTADSTLKIWNLNDQNKPLLLELAAHEGRVVTSMALDPDGRRLVTGDRSGEVREWNLPALLRSPPRECHSSPVKDPLLISADQRVVVSGGNGDHSVMVWDVATGMPRHCWRSAHTDQFVTPVAVTDTAVVSNARNEVHVWDLQVGTRVHAMKHGSPYGSLTASYADGDTLYTGDLDGPLATWDVQHGRVNTLPAAIAHAIQIQPFDTNQLLVAAYKNGQPSPLMVVDQTTGQIAQQFGTNTGPPAVYRTALITHNAVVGTTHEGRVSAWNRKTGALLDDRMLDGGKGEHLWTLPDGRIALLNRQPAILWLMAPDFSTCERFELGPLLWCPTVSDDGTLLCGRDNHQINLIHLPDCTTVGTFNPGSKVCALAMRGETLAAGLQDGRVLVFRVHGVHRT